MCFKEDIFRSCCLAGGRTFFLNRRADCSRIPLFSVCLLPFSITFFPFFSLSLSFLFIASFLSVSVLPLFFFTFCIAIPVAQESDTTGEFAESGEGTQPLLKGYCILKIKPPGHFVPQLNGAC